MPLTRRQPPHNKQPTGTPAAARGSTSGRIAYSVRRTGSASSADQGHQTSVPQQSQEQSHLQLQSPQQLPQLSLQPLQQLPQLSLQPLQQLPQLSLQPLQQLPQHSCPSQQLQLLSAPPSPQTPPLQQLSLLLPPLQP
jgi:hypothetical protein